MKKSREKRSLEERVLNLEISNLYRSLTSRLIEIYDEQQRKPEQRSTSDESFDVNEAARRLGVSTGLVRKQVRERRLRHHRIGRLIRFSQQDIDVPPSIVPRKNHKGGDQKGSKQGSKATEVSIARRLKQLVEEMRKW